MYAGARERFSGGFFCGALFFPFPYLFLFLFLSEPQVSSATCGFGFIGVSCSGKRCLKEKKKRNENVDVSSVLDQCDEVPERDRK